MRVQDPPLDAQSVTNGWALRAEKHTLLVLQAMLPRKVVLGYQMWVQAVHCAVHLCSMPCHVMTSQTASALTACQAPVDQSQQQLGHQTGW
jgi:hypothetical protein